MWCIPEKQSHHFVAGMERVLKVYQRPYDQRHPVVCMDEMSKQLVAEVREELPVRPGSRRSSTTPTTSAGENATTVWMFGEPLSGWRTVAVTKRRTTLDLGEASAHAGEPAALPGCGNHHAGVRQLEYPQR